MPQKIMQHILSEREKTILFITIGVVIFALAFNFIIAPFYTKNDLLNKEINITRTKLKKYLWLLSQKESIQAQFSKFSSISYVPGPQQNTMAGVFSELENLAKDANIHIIDIRPQDTSAGSALYNENLIELRTEGIMEAYLKFIYNLESSFSLLRIKKFRLTAGPHTQSLEGAFTISKPTVP